MPYIEIKEQDLTSPSGGGENTDVVYIPGFVDTRKEKNEKLYDDKTGEYIGIATNKPTLFTSLAQFERMCGKRGVVFDEDQRFTDLAANGAIDNTFDEDAIPFDGVMFYAGSEDPAYVMAKELLIAGLPVLYERMNSDPGREKVELTEKPEDWDSIRKNYEEKITRYIPIFSRTVPTFGLVKATGTKWSNDTRYYRLNKSESEDTEDSNYMIFSVVTSDTVDRDSSDGLVTDTNAYIYDADSENKYVLFEEKTKTTGESFGSAERYRKNVDGSFTKYETEPDEWENENTTFRYYSKVDIANNFVVKVDGKEGELPDQTTYIKDYKINNKWVSEYPNYYQETEDFIDLADDTQRDFNDKASYYKKTSGTTIVDMYSALRTAYEITEYGSGLDDKGNYSIKYLTSGGYPTYEYANNVLVEAMKNLANERGDCVALIDHTDNILREPNPDRPESIIYKIRQMSGVSGDAAVDPWSYAAMFTPWAKYVRTSVEKDSSDMAINANNEPDLVNLTTIRMPASFAYLMALADSIKTYPNWMAIAGVTRGIVPNLADNGMTTVIPNGVADYMVSEKPKGNYMKVRAINPITNINPYGETIWGNRTLASNKDGIKATSILSIRNLVSDVKKLVYRTCRKMTYEPNSEQLWVNIQAAITPTLDKMKSGQGISGYQLALNKEHDRWGEKATLCFKIILYPIYPVEAFFVDIILKDDEVEIFG